MSAKPIKYVAKAKRDGNKQQLLIRPKDLRPHPLLGRVGLLPELIAREDAKGRKSGKNREDHKALALELGSEFEALKTSIRTNGLVEPIKVVREAGGWAIADGRNRWEACREIDADKPIRCEEISKEAARGVILAAMTRRHMSKQARSLMAVKIYPEIVEEATVGRKSRNDCGISQIDLAQQIGVSTRTMEEACHFWRTISLNPKTAEERMNQVLAGLSFDRVLQGDAAAGKSKDAPRSAKKPWLLMNRNANSLKLLWKDYEQITDNEKKLGMVEVLADALAAAPADVKPALVAALERGNA